MAFFMAEVAIEAPTEKRPRCIHCGVLAYRIPGRDRQDGAQWYECMNPDCPRPARGVFGWWVKREPSKHG
jgi:hypothetical protein